MKVHCVLCAKEAPDSHSTVLCNQRVNVRQVGIPHAWAIPIYQNEAT